MMIGIIVMIVGAGSTVIRLSGVNFGAGPFSASVYGIPAFSASLIFIGLVVFIVGAMSLAAIAKVHW